MKKKNRATRPRRFGCLRLMLMLSIACVAVCSICWVTNNVFYSPSFQEPNYRIKQSTNTAVPVAKESDMIDYIKDVFQSKCADFLLNFETRALMEGLA